MTNADCIRRMSDEQLYDFLSEWELGDIDYAVTFCDLCEKGGNTLNLDCDGCRKHWLKRDAADYGGLMYWKRNTTYKDLPTIEVVKCKECKYAEKCEQIVVFDIGEYQVEGRKIDYCSYGERIDNE